MSERFTVMIGRMLSAALGPNPLDAICPDMPAHEVAPRLRMVRLARAARPRMSRLSVA
jgi:hypothetical protein